MEKRIKAEDRIGERHGKLIVTDIAYSDGLGKTMVNVECDCGKSAIQRLGALVSGVTKSCGCESLLARKRNVKVMQSKRPKDMKSHVSPFEWTIITALMGYSRRAARNHTPLPVPFELTREEYIKIINGNCHYCGEGHCDSRGFKYSRIQDSHIHQGKIYKCVGIDRLDSQKGYTSDNSVPCCETCNRMKMDLEVNTFIRKCKKIAEEDLSRFKTSQTK